MIGKIENKNMGKGDFQWLKTNYHFSFANYYNPDNIQFGVLRVLNDDIIKPHSGFDTHPHKDMEIITYVIEGQLTHEDSHGNRRTVGRGDVQYMSAGKGIYHSEYNHGDEDLRLLQIWIKPDKPGLEPNYGDLSLPFDKRLNKWLKLVSSVDRRDAEILIHQDAVVSVAFLEKGRDLTYHLDAGRQAYLVQIEGNSTINNIDLNMRDAMEITGESITINSKADSHFLLIEMNS